MHQGRKAAICDIHTLTAAEALGIPPTEVTSEQRRAAKAVNFGAMYGTTQLPLNVCAPAIDVAEREVVSALAKTIPNLCLWCKCGWPFEQKDIDTHVNHSGSLTIQMPCDASSVRAVLRRWTMRRLCP